MVTGLPLCNGYDAILMIVNRFSKEIVPITCSTELLSEGLVKILCDEVYAKHGMPQVVISDQGMVFVSKFMQDLYNLLQIKSNVLGTCQIDEGNSHKWRSTECMGFGKAISNVTLEPKP